jgi:hypothetical protein
MRRKTFWGSETRANDGCIVTFELEDGQILVEQFSQTVFSTQRRGDRKTHRVGIPYVLQAAERADELQARIVSISSPSTVLTDLQGTRARLEAQSSPDGLKGGMQQGPANLVSYPEVMMLGKIKRIDLFKRPVGGTTEQNIRQVHQRRPTHSGRNDQ